MKTMIAFGLVIFSLLLVMALRRTGTSPHAVPEGKPASAESQRVFTAAHTRNVASHALQATQPVQPIHAILLVAVEAETDSDRRSEALERAVESVLDAELPAMLDSLALEASPHAAELRQLLVHRWAETNAPAAAAWATQLPEGSARRAALEQVAITWANADLSASAGWVRTLPEGDSKQAATLGLAYEAARTEPVMALELVSTSSPTRERDDVLVHSVSQWAGADSAAAAAWAATVPDPSLRQRLVAAAAVASAEQDGAAAAALAANSLVAGEEQDRTAVSIVQRWVQNSPQAAASWVSQFPDIPLREAAVQNLLALWTAQDAQAANNWLRELPAGPLRDLGITAYDQALAYRDQSSAVVAPAGGM
jgi:hypothetical protein